MDPQQLAEASARALWEQDRASQGLGIGIVIDGVGPGTATLSMVVGAAMCNGHGTCHGGFIFALADSAFAYACNSHGQRAVAQHVAITYVAPAAEGDLLTARAREISRRGRTGLYDVSVANGQGEVVAEFRGASRTVKGMLVPEESGE
ncbi:hydroxyphenylacetyl-CoA thioesterase PaaI [uncultured Alsobacter sp.]|uniref:hydroxyphenylacetyl-CoA thioesterase PaaI n=1 Tax=uncultured Alsobacter sp. TaxID=1748258 RepID=UPI0025FED53E|nr:hydroxyphenylacetyl-CoA thioesterase PaaI [uncultured Alsobacter sp.]